MTTPINFLSARSRFVAIAATLAATTSMVATRLPVRADLVFEYRTVEDITQQSPGTLIDPDFGLQLQLGGPDVFLQIVLKDTGTVGVPSPTNPVIGSSARDRLIGWGFRLNFAENEASQLIATGIQPLNDANNSRTGLTAFGFSNPVITKGSDGAATPSFAVLRNVTLSGAYDPSNLYPLVNIRIHPNAANLGTGSFSIVDNNASADDIGTTNQPSFDPGIFDQPFVLPVAVSAALDPDVLVSNFAETIRDSTPIANPQYWAAQSFSTDNRPYTLTSIGAMIGNSENSPQVVAELHRADVNNEIDLSAEGLVTTLTGPELTSGSPESQLFTPDGNVILESNTRYWLVLGSSNDGTFVWSYAEGSHFVGPGTLSDFADSSDAGGTWGYSIGPFNPYMIQVKVAEYSLPGDYNHNGTVDAADYVVWRKTFGLTGEGLAADGDGNLQVDDDDLVIWRSHFGDTAFPELGDRVSAAVPEPGSLMLLAVAALLLAKGRAQLLH